MGRKAKPAKVQYVDGALRVFYPDGRVEPRLCVRTNMRREFCPCAPCRVLRRRKHRASCTCWLCFTDRMGAFIDQLGRGTAARRWLWFLTLTFRTPNFPWKKGFPMEQPMPCPDFVRSFHAKMLAWVSREVHSEIEFFTAHQFGEINGRIHLHCGLSWPGLFEYRWRDLQAMLWRDAGFNRILPWKQDAAYYIGRYIGRDAHRANWDWNVGNREQPIRLLSSLGREVVAASPVPEESSRAYRQTMGSWHR